MATDFAETLRVAGLQVTAQRVSVLRSVDLYPHATADELSERVRSDIGTVSKQAVYDSLGVLSENRLIRRIEPAGSPARYETRVDNHHHLICRKCGKVVDVDYVKGKAPSIDIEDDHGFIIDEAEVIYWGTCPDCQEKAKT